MRCRGGGRGKEGGERGGGGRKGERGGGGSICFADRVENHHVNVGHTVYVYLLHTCLHTLLQYGAWATSKKLRCWQNLYCTAGSAQHMLCILV